PGSFYQAARPLIVYRHASEPRARFSHILTWLPSRHFAKPVTVHTFFRWARKTLSCSATPSASTKLIINSWVPARLRRFHGTPRRRFDEIGRKPLISQTL